MTAKDELESENRTITIKLAKITDELAEEVGNAVKILTNIH